MPPPKKARLRGEWVALLKQIKCEGGRSGNRILCAFCGNVVPVRGEFVSRVFVVCGVFIDR